MTAAVLLLALSAPAPVPKPPPTRPALAGVVWAFDWHGSEGLLELRPSGVWWAWWGGREWAGSYKLEGDTLDVSEWHALRNEWERGGTPYEWSATLKPGTLEGRTAAGGTFRMWRPKK